MSTATSTKPAARKATKTTSKIVKKANASTTVTKKSPEKTEKTKVEKKKEKIDPLSMFVYMDEVKTILDVSLATNKNCILHGKGGYGKSEFTLAYLEEKGIEPYVITMGSGMTTDRLFGGVDLAKFNIDGKIEYLIKNSFMNHEFVIFEELFDAPDFILEQLKDILSSRVFRNGSQIFDIKTTNIICCTNKTREEFAKNNSLKALMERFPLELEVKWSDHNRLTYEKLLETKYGKGNADPMLTYVLEQFAKKGFTISPRIALVASDIIRTCGPDCLGFIAEFNAKKDILKDSISKFKGLALVNEKVTKIEEYLKDVTALVDEGLLTSTETDLAKVLLKKLYSETSILSKIKVDDSLAVTIGKKVSHYKERYNRLKKEVEVTENVTSVIESTETI